MRVALLGDAPRRNAQLLAGHFEGEHVELVMLRDDHDPALAGIDVLVSRTWPDTAMAGTRLGLLQIPAAGMETIRLDAVPEHVTVCNATGHEAAMAEYVTGTLMLLLRDLLAAQHAFRSRYSAVRERDTWPYSREIGGSTVAILGAGGVARETAKRLAAFGAAVRICSRRPVVMPDGEAIRWYEARALEDLCRDADALVIACPLTADTEGLVGAEHFRHLRRGVVVNVSRAGIVRLPDLLSALTDGTLAGAALDVWDGIEPVQFSNLTACPSVFVTPHLSAWTQAAMQRRWTGIAENLRAYALRKPLRNVVRAGRG